MAEILIVAKYADNRGGADVYTQGLVTSLVQRGHSIKLMCHSASEVVRDACTVITVPEPLTGDQRLIWRIATVLYQRQWRAEINQLDCQPNAIISCLPLSCRDLRRKFPRTPLIYLPHSRVAPIEATASITGSAIQKRISSIWYSRGERWSLRNADATVRLTDGNVRELRQYYGLPESAVFEVIPAPTSLPVSSQRSAGASNRTDRLRLLTVGRLVESKNLFVFLHMLSKLKSDQWQLEIAGDGPQRHLLQETTKELQLDSQVTFLGHCDDMNIVYQNVDLHLFPSIRESFGLVILEAMANGVPTLAYKPDGTSIVTSSDEIITHEVDGLLACNEQHFRDLLSRSLLDRNFLRSLGQEGRRKVIQSHSWDHVASAWESTLLRVI